MPDPDDQELDFKAFINKDSLLKLKLLRLNHFEINEARNFYQFIRKSLFATDLDSTSENLIFNRTVSLKDSWQNTG